MGGCELLVGAEPWASGARYPASLRWSTATLPCQSLPRRAQDGDTLLFWVTLGEPRASLRVRLPICSVCSPSERIPKG